MHSLRRVLFSAVFLLTTVFLSAQTKSQDRDSLVSLLSAKSVSLSEKGGESFRHVQGPARFFHNDTYLLCDSAVWNVNYGVIEAMGNVRILQDETELSSDRLTYLIEQSLAQFRGSLVELTDKEGNRLRTKFLDYNTKDSVAFFQNGASMKDKDGSVMESLNGTYDSKAKLFTFLERVNMYTAGSKVKTDLLEYNTASGKAFFHTNTHAWKDESMLSSDAGSYNRIDSVFVFNKNVHMMDTTREGWCDTLIYSRSAAHVELFGNAQINDEAQDAKAFGDYISYSDSLKLTLLTRNPSLVGITEKSSGDADTLWFRADTIFLKSRLFSEISTDEVDISSKRLADIRYDAVSAYKKKAAEDAKSAEETRRQELLKEGKIQKGKVQSQQPSEEVADAPAVQAGVIEKSAPEPDEQKSSELDEIADTTKIYSVRAYRNAKLFRRDMQMVCDSLEYVSLDSLARLYKRPFVWNEANRQYCADSIIVLTKDKKLNKASLQGDAFVVVEEAPECYDQIRGTELIAYFNDDSQLRRFDALGDASAVFYLKEDSVYATVNKAEAKMLYATFADGEVDRVTYFQTAKNDVYPLAQLRKKDRELKGFLWNPDQRPSSPQDIFTRNIRSTQRQDYQAEKLPTYPLTEIYFPGYMKQAFDDYAQAKQREQQRKSERSKSSGRKDRNDIVVDSTKVLSLPDSTSTSPVDSTLSQTASQADSLSAAGTVADSLLASTNPKKARRDSLNAERERLRALKIAKRDARWAQLDSLDAEKLARKKEQQLQKERKRKLRFLERTAARQAKENERLERYKEALLKRKEAEESRKKLREERMTPTTENQ